MSRYDYQLSKRIEKLADYDSFYGVIMGAMRLADSDNLAKLRDASPQVWDELQLRYNAPGALLPGESAPDLGVKMADDGSLVDIPKGRRGAKK